MLIGSACRNKPGVARQLVTFFCFAKRKVTKEKATRRLGPYASLRATCAARLRRQSKQLACGSNKFGLTFRLRLRCSAQPHRGGK